MRSNSIKDRQVSGHCIDGYYDIPMHKPYYTPFKIWGHQPFIWGSTWYRKVVTLHLFFAQKLFFSKTTQAVQWILMTEISWKW